MANNVTEYLDKLTASAVKALRQRAAILRNVNKEFETNPGIANGNIVHVPIPSAIATRAVAPGPVSVAPGGLVPTSVPIPIDNWQEAPFAITNKEVAEINAKHIPGTISAAVKALVNDVATDVYSYYKYLYSQAGTPGTRAFASKTTADAAEVGMLLDTELADVEDRFAVVTPNTKANMEQVPSWLNVDQSGSTETTRMREIGFRSGAEWYMDQLLPTHTNGNMGAGTAIKTGTAHAIGLQTLTVTGGTGGVTFNEGDVITVAGDPYQYVVRNSPSVTIGDAADGSVTVNPGLRIALTGDEAITLDGANDLVYDVNIQAHRECFALASRTTMGNDVLRMLGVQSTINPLGAAYDRETFDPVTGLALRLLVKEEHYQTYVALSLCWGAGVARPQLGARIASD